MTGKRMVCICMAAILCLVLQAGFGENAGMADVLSVVEQGGKARLAKKQTEGPERGQLLSTGPDGTTLWYVYDGYASYYAAVRDGETVPLAVSETRGAADAAPGLYDTLNYKLNINADWNKTEVRWSPDGRYAFFYDEYLWLSVHMYLMDPFLLDTQTGEIFAVEAGGWPKKPAGDMPFRFILNGRFSQDGKSFFYYSREYETSPSAGYRHFLMKYNLETEELETVYEGAAPMVDFCEAGAGRWVVLERNPDAPEFLNLIRLSPSAEGYTADRETVDNCCVTYRVYPAPGGKVLLVAGDGEQKMSAVLLIEPGKSAAESGWRKIVDIFACEMKAVSPEEIKADAEAIRISFYESYGSAVIRDNAYISGAVAVNGSPYMLLQGNMNQSIRGGWVENDYYPFSGLLLLNTETMYVYPAAFYSSRIWFNLLPDRAVNSSNGMLDLGAYVLEPDDSGEDFELKFEDWYRYSYGSYQYLGTDRDGLKVLTPGIMLQNVRLEETVAVQGTGYGVEISYSIFPEPETERTEYLVPEAVTAERFEEITAGMSKKDQKKLKAHYSIYRPKDLAGRKNGDELLASYPALATEDMYVLKTDRTDHNLLQAQEILAAAGYTREDFEKDSANVAVSMGSNVRTRRIGEQITGTPYYRFRMDEPSGAIPAGRMMQLACVSDRINCEVYFRYLCDREASASVQELIPETCDVDGTVWHIRTESVAETEDSLTVTLTVFPEN